MTILLPLPPPQNHLYTGTGKGRHKSDRYEAWISEAGAVLMQARASRQIIKLGPGWYRTEILYPANDRADVDARAKALHDLLHRMQITPDDKHLWGNLQERSHDVPNGMCRLRFWTIDDPSKASAPLAP